MTASTTRLLLAGAAMCLAGAGSAQQAATATTDAPRNAPQAAFGDAALDEEGLGRIAGREDTGKLVASADQRNTVSNNSVNGVSTTGAVQIDGNAFQNLQGMAVINANSGNNVAINSAMNVTIVMGGPQ